MITTCMQEKILFAAAFDIRQNELVWIAEDRLRTELLRCLLSIERAIADGEGVPFRDLYCHRPAGCILDIMKWEQSSCLFCRATRGSWRANTVETSRISHTLFE